MLAHHALDTYRAELHAWRQYAPALVVVLLATLQAAFVLAHGGLERRRLRRRAQQTAVTTTTRKTALALAPTQWFDGSAWDDVVVAAIGGGIALTLCDAGYTGVAWSLLLPVLVTGGLSVTHSVVARVKS